MATERPMKDLLPDLIDAAKVLARSRATDIKPDVKRLAAYAYENGVDSEQLTDVVELLTHPNHLDQASQNLVISNLYPLQDVSNQVVLKIIGCLGFGDKPPLVMQSRLLDWLILSHHVLADSNVLSRAYSAMFNLLGVDTIRPQLFHLLALSTQRKHVTHHRIQALLAITAQKGGDPLVQGLLQIYKNYYPEIPASRARKSPFKLPDPEWRVHLLAVRQAHRQRQIEASSGLQNGFKVDHAHEDHLSRGSIPRLQTSNAHEKAVTLEEVDSADKLVQNLEKIQMPDYIVAVLVDPLLQKFLTLRPDLGLKRATPWMQSQVDDILRGELPASEILQLLKTARDYAVATKSMLPFASTLVGAYEDLTGSSVDQAWRRDLLTFQPMVEWDTFFASATRVSIENGLDGTTASQVELLRIYKRLLHRWTIAMLSSQPSPTDTSITCLMSHVDSLCLTLLQNPSPSQTVLHTVLDFYSEVASTTSHSQLLGRIPFTIPPPSIIYTLFFSTCPAIFSRTCSLLVRFKNTFVSRRTSQSSGSYDKSKVDDFNGFLMDTSNCLWRDKAFSKSDRLARGCLLSDANIEALRTYLETIGGDLHLESVFGLSCAPTLSAKAVEYVRGKEDAVDQEEVLRVRHEGPVTAKSLRQLARKGGMELSWEDYRTDVLEHLQAEGLGGVPELLQNTIKRAKSQ